MIALCEVGILVFVSVKADELVITVKKMQFK